MENKKSGFPGGIYAQTTGYITVTVEPFYLEEQSSPDDEHYVWAYRVRIENKGPETVQLLSRHWRITDSNGIMQDVRGEGVVGEKPVLSTGEVFEYTSGTPLGTPSGIMVGTYSMREESGAIFNVHVPAFSLDSPYQKVLLQ